jgi:hypothetical protein
MRIRRTIIAPTLLAIGTVGSLVVSPTIAVMSTATPATAAVAIAPSYIGYHG